MTSGQKIKAFKDFPPLYLILFLVSCFFTVLWLLLFLSRFGIVVIDLSTATPLVRLGWPVVLVQFLFSALTFIGILKFALLRIEHRFYKSHTSETIDSLQETINSLREKLQKYEPGDEAYPD